MTSDIPGWFKSSYSGGANTECVEVAAVGGRALVRDSKDPDGPVLAFSSAEWGAFVDEVRAGRVEGGGWAGE